MDMQHELKREKERNGKIKLHNKGVQIQFCRFLFRVMHFINYNKFDNLLMKERLFSTISHKYASTHTQMCER